MTARGFLRGHPIIHQEGRWVFEATGIVTTGAWQYMPCGLCGRFPTPEGHDPCLGTLPGVRNACCGHGQPEQAYIQFENGIVVRGFHLDRGDR